MECTNNYSWHWRNCELTWLRSWYLSVASRAVNNALLDTYQLKSLDAVLEAKIDIVEIVKNGSKLYLRAGKHMDVDILDRDNFAMREPYDRIIRCLGFKFNDSLFSRSLLPQSFDNLNHLFFSHCLYASVSVPLDINFNLILHWLERHLERTLVVAFCIVLYAKRQALRQKQDKCCGLPRLRLPWYQRTEYETRTWGSRQFKKILQNKAMVPTGFFPGSCKPRG